MSAVTLRADAPAKDASLRGVAVLVLSPRSTARAALVETLVAAGASAESATVEAPRAASGIPVSVVLVDARARGANAVDAAEQVARLRHPGRIVLLVGSGRRGDAARCRELGIAAYLTRPLRRADLVAAIAMVAETRPGSPAVPLVTRHLVAGKPDPLRILFAEDDPALRTLVSTILEKRGHAVVATANGRQALLALEGGRFDVLLTDVEMPELDGVGTLKALRERERANPGRRLPVVAMTGRALDEERDRLLEAGMDGYVAKPLVPEDLFFTLESVAGGWASPDCRRSRPPGSAAFDPAALLVEVDGDIALLDFMVSLFREDWPERVRRIDAAIRERRAGDLASAAHALKGSIGTFRAGDSFETARRLELLGRQGDFAGARETLSALEQKLQRLESRLLRFIRDKRK